MYPAVAFPVIRDSHAADESQSSVDDQNFSMRPKVNAREMDEAENFDRDTGAFHQFDGASVDCVASKRILKKMHFHTVTRAFRERLSEASETFAFPEQKIFKRNCALRRMNTVQHCREDLIPVSLAV